MLAVGGGDSMVRLWDPERGEEFGTLTHGDIGALAWGQLGDRPVLVSSSSIGDGRIWLWDVEVERFEDRLPSYRTDDPTDPDWLGRDAEAGRPSRNDHRSVGSSAVGDRAVRRLGGRQDPGCWTGCGGRARRSRPLRWLTALPPASPSTTRTPWPGCWTGCGRRVPSSRPPRCCAVILPLPSPLTTRAAWPGCWTACGE